VVLVCLYFLAAFSKRKEIKKISKIKPVNNTKNKITNYKIKLIVKCYNN
jgi:hypothetical protein